MADDDWTFVPRKKQGKAAPNSTISHTPLSIKDATLEDIAREYGIKSRIWKRSEARQQVGKVGHGRLLFRPFPGPVKRQILGIVAFSAANRYPRRRKTL